MCSDDPTFHFYLWRPMYVLCSVMYGGGREESSRPGLQGCEQLLYARWRYPRVRSMCTHQRDATSGQCPGGQPRLDSVPVACRSLAVVVVEVMCSSDTIACFLCYRGLAVNWPWCLPPPRAVVGARLVLGGGVCLMRDSRFKTDIIPCAPLEFGVSWNLRSSGLRSSG